MCGENVDFRLLPTRIQILVFSPGFDRFENLVMDWGTLVIRNE